MCRIVTQYFFIKEYLNFLYSLSKSMPTSYENIKNVDVENHVVTYKIKILGCLDGSVG